MLKPQVLAALLLVAVLTFAAVWIDGKTGGEAEPVEPILWRWGNATIIAPPYDSDVQVVRAGESGDLTLTVSATGSKEYLQIDAQTGAILHDDVTGGDRQAMDEILASLTSGPIDPGTAVWPYSDTGRPEETFRAGGIEFVVPDPAAGILLHGTELYGGGSLIGFRNERSTVSVDTKTGLVVAEATVIHPDDQTAFDRLLSGVVVIAGP